VMIRAKEKVAKVEIREVDAEMMSWILRTILKILLGIVFL